MKLGVILSGNTLIEWTSIISPSQKHCNCYGGKYCLEYPEIKASFMKLVIWTGADYAHHFCHHIKLIVGGCYGNQIVQMVYR